MAPVRAYSARVQEKTWSLSLDGDDMCLWRSIVGSGFGVGVNRMMPQFFPTLSDVRPAVFIMFTFIALV